MNSVEFETLVKALAPNPKTKENEKEPFGDTDKLRKKPYNAVIDQGEIEEEWIKPSRPGSGKGPHNLGYNNTEPGVYAGDYAGEEGNEQWKNLGKSLVFTPWGEQETDCLIQIEGDTNFAKALVNTPQGLQFIDVEINYSEHLEKADSATVPARVKAMREAGSVVKRESKAADWPPKYYGQEMEPSKVRQVSPEAQARIKEKTAEARKKWKEGGGPERDKAGAKQTMDAIRKKREALGVKGPMTVKRESKGSGSEAATKPMKKGFDPQISAVVPEQAPSLLKGYGTVHGVTDQQIANTYAQIYGSDVSMPVGQPTWGLDPSRDLLAGSQQNPLPPVNPLMVNNQQVMQPQTMQMNPQVMRPQTMQMNPQVMRPQTMQMNSPQNSNVVNQGMMNPSQRPEDGFEYFHNPVAQMAGGHQPAGDSRFNVPNLLQQRMMEQGEGDGFYHNGY